MRRIREIFCAMPKRGQFDKALVSIDEDFMVIHDYIVALFEESECPSENYINEISRLDIARHGKIGNNGIFGGFVG